MPMAESDPPEIIMEKQSWKKWLAGITACTLALFLVIGTLKHRHPHQTLKPSSPGIPHGESAKNLSPNYNIPDGIVLHDSDTPSKFHGLEFNAAMLEKIHTQDHPGWATEFEGKTYHIAYHYIILPSGKVEQGRPEHCIGTHARRYNHWLGICLIGAFSTSRHTYPEKPTSEQMKSLVSLCVDIMNRYHIPLDRVKRHRDVNDTYCPGDRFPYETVLDLIKKRIPADLANPSTPLLKPASLN